MELEGPEFKPRFVYFVSYVALHYSATLSPCVLLVGIRQDLMQPNEVPLYLSVLVSPQRAPGQLPGAGELTMAQRCGESFHQLSPHGDFTMQQPNLIKVIQVIPEGPFLLPTTKMQLHHPLETE